MNVIDLSNFFEELGVESSFLVEILQIVTLLLYIGIVGWLVWFVSKKWVSKIILKISSKTSTYWDDYFFNQSFFNKLALFLTPIAIKAAPYIEWEHLSILNKLINSWIIIASVQFAGAILDGINRIYDSYPVSKDRPLKVFSQVIMMFLYCIALIVIIGIFTEKDITVLLGGLTVFASVLMLIFKDSILGLVAGIQLAANKMVRIGDWIEMPSSRADGDVLEINLTTVKVQNWDKTITTIPTYKLVSESFTNWRGMEESKGRRIKRSVNIDVYSVHYLSEEELEILKQSKLLKEYIENKLKDLREFNANRGNKLDERRLTNIGTFREYMESWLSNNPDINLEMTHMVRQLQPGPTGIPLEIYCFSARQKWVEYERVQADIFDHLYAVMELFNLKAFQYSGFPIEK